MIRVAATFMISQEKKHETTPFKVPLEPRVHNSHVVGLLRGGNEQKNYILNVYFHRALIDDFFLKNGE